MKTPDASAAVFPTHIASPSGLSFEINANGSVRRIDHRDIMINLFLGNEMEGGPLNIHLRRLGKQVESIPLTGPSSSSSFITDECGMTVRGEWKGLHYRARLALSQTAPAWFWHVEIENTSDESVTCDLILTQDIALAHYGAIRLNEYYVSQYVDHTPLDHPRHGRAVASRQNQSMGGRCPWLVTASLARGVSHATDALQFYGFTSRTGATPVALTDGLPGKRLQHEHSMACIQDESFVLKPGTSSRRGFCSWFEADKPDATSAADVRFIDLALSLPEGDIPIVTVIASGESNSASLFTTAPLLESADLDDAEITRFFGDERLHAERDDGTLLSFFADDRKHVVMRAKDLSVLRPHGHLMRTGSAMVPDESALTSTAWMGGVFHSMVTQGHVSINRFLSTCHTYLGLFRSHGQKVFMEIEGRWHLLGLPSAFEMTPDSCRWIYKHHGGVIEVISTAPADKHSLGLSIRVLDGPATRFLISHHVALHGDDGSASVPLSYSEQEDGVFVTAIPDSDVGRRFPDGGFIVKPFTGIETIGDDALLFNNGLSRNQPFLCFVTKPSLTAGLSIEGCLLETSVPQLPDFWNAVTAGLRIDAPAASAIAPAAGRLAGIFPWFVHNALVHYLSPRGLEQYSGGGWGTRDVCQGPVELLLALGRFEPIRDLLCRVFRQQNADGDWPQWFMFFERERSIRPGDSHGDIVYWPVLALAQYLTATGDMALLDETLPFFHPDGDAHTESATIWQHVERAVDLMLGRVIHGTTLAAYGHGDWNDSLQPAKPDMRERLCSSWTVTLNHQTFTALADVFRSHGDKDRAATFENMAANILNEFQQLLVVDDVVAGLVYFHESGKTDHLLHPRDTSTGLSYSVLPMIHAIINDMFTPRQAENHLALIRKHLSGPDGAHLFDKPIAYHGGPQTFFQRAESASYFGREIGIMYTHAHLRYCEALARYGDAAAFFDALCRINPIAIRELVPPAAMRQANCYYSSSDPAFADRYEAYDDYAKVNRGEVALEGGWRVYSSGAGIGARLIIRSFLGIAQENNTLVIDPVIPATLDGMTATLRIAEQTIHISYRIAAKGCGPVSINLNGADLDFLRSTNAYRPGAARIPMDTFIRSLAENDNQLTVWIG